jgi:Pyruvate/2-oxoacid:ferredoxin oxidoreductase gamma subunit
VDASAIARSHGLGSKTQPIVNTAILGAFASFLGLVKLESVCRAIREDIPRAEANIAAASEAAAQLRVAAPMVEVARV